MKIFAYILITLGIILFVLAFLFRIMHWPGFTQNLVVGTTFLIAGIVLVRKNQKKSFNKGAIDEDFFDDKNL